MIIDNLAATFTPEEAYTPPRNTGGRFKVHSRLITRTSFVMMMRNKKLSAIWWTAAFSLSAVVAVFDLLLPTLIFFISFGVALLLHLWVTIVLVKVSNGLSFEEGKQIHRVEDGWFPDPWAFGEVGRLRLFQNGKWTEEVKYEKSNPVRTVRT